MSDIKQLEDSIDESRKLVELKNAALKLSSNREFKKIILDGYFKDEAVRLAEVSAIANPNVDRNEVFLAIQAISLLKQYLQSIVRVGEMAEEDIYTNGEALDDARVEDAA